jgi:hypothetical protein
MSPELTDETVVVASGDHVAEDVGDETIVLSLDTGEYYGLSGVGGRIWDLLQSPTTGKEILNVIGKEYDVDPDRCRADVMDFLDTLAEEELVDVTSQSESQ